MMFVKEEIIMENRHKPEKKHSSIYTELSIEFDPQEVSWMDGSHQNSSEIEKRVVIKNGGQAVKECRCFLEELAYHFGDAWIDPPNGYEKKALRWIEEGAVSAEGIEIPAYGSARLAIVQMNRFPNPYFGIPYSDGSCGKTHHFTGVYRMRLRLDGALGDNSESRVIAPTDYEIYLRYSGALELIIEDIVRVSPA